MKYSYMVRPSSKEPGKYGIFAVTGPNKAVEIYTSYNVGYDGENESYTELDALYDDEEEYLNFVKKTGVKIE